MSALEERRKAALEAGEAADDHQSYTGRSIEVAIETATRVRITPAMLDAMNPHVGNRETRLRAALKAAGFEVEE